MFTDVKQYLTEKYPSELSAPDTTEQFRKIYESVLQVGSELHRIFLESKSFIAMGHEIFPRGDYQHCVYYVAFVMNMKST